MRLDRRHSRVWMTCVVSSVALLLAGCGSTVDEAELAAAGNGGGTDGAAVAAPEAVSGVDPAIDAGAGGTVPAAGAITDPGTAAVGTTATTAPGTVTTDVAKPGKDGANAAAAGAGTGPVVATGANAPCAKTLSPIRLGQTMAVSGVVGAAIQGMRPGTAAWAAAVNARGGIQCHPVELIQLDDGSDPSKVSANYNTLVKQRGVVAIVAAGVPITFKAMQTSAERDKFPIVGGDLVPRTGTGARTSSRRAGSRSLPTTGLRAREAGRGQEDRPDLLRRGLHLHRAQGQPREGGRKVGPRRRPDQGGLAHAAGLQRRVQADEGRGRRRPLDRHRGLGCDPLRPVLRRL